MEKTIYIIKKLFQRLLYNIKFIILIVIVFLLDVGYEKIIFLCKTASQGNKTITAYIFILSSLFLIFLGLKFFINSFKIIFSQSRSGTIRDFEYDNKIDK